MSVELQSPASLSQMAEMAGLLTPVQWRVLRDMWRASDSYAFVDTGKLLAVAGFYTLPEGGFESWFQFNSMAPAQLRQVIRITRLTLSERPYASPVTLCVTNEGKRFAALCGFIFVAQSPMGEIWAYDDGTTSWSRSAEQHSGAAATTATGCTLAPAGRSQ